MNNQINTPDSTPTGQKEADIMDDEFILLEDLVYAPLHALVKANQELQAQVVETIKSMGESKQNGKEETIHLSNINIAYDQLHPETEESCSVDKLQVQVPLLSIVPVTALSVEKAEISFSAEVKAVTNEAGEKKINARVCAPALRDSDFLPKVSYKLQISSVPANEGFLRLTDMLSVNQVAKKLDSTPIVLDGEPGDEEQKNFLQENKRLRARISRLKLLYRKISDMMKEQERLYEIHKDVLTEGMYEYDRNRYVMAQSRIMNQIMKYQEQMVEKELLYELEKEFE